GGVAGGGGPAGGWVACEWAGGGGGGGPSAAALPAGPPRVWEESGGGAEPIHDARSLAGPPGAARRYVTALEDHAGAPIVLVSVGPERTQTIERAWRPMRRRIAAVAGGRRRSRRGG